MKATGRQQMPLQQKQFGALFLGYFVLGTLFGLSSGMDMTVFDRGLFLYGGIRAGVLADNFTRLLTWISSFLPLLILLGMQIFDDLSGRIYYTIIRDKSRRAWWNRKFRFTMTYAFLFSLVMFVALTLTGIFFGSSKELLHELPKMVGAFVLVSIYNMLLSVSLVSLSICIGNLKIPFSILFCFVLLNYSIGKFLPTLNVFLVGTYSMVNRTVLVDVVYGVEMIPAIATMIVLMIGSYFLGLSGTKKCFLRINQ